MSVLRGHSAPCWACRWPHCPLETGLYARQTSNIPALQHHSQHSSWVILLTAAPGRGLTSKSRWGSRWQAGSSPHCCLPSSLSLRPPWVTLLLCPAAECHQAPAPKSQHPGPPKPGCQVGRLIQLKTSPGTDKTQDHRAVILLPARPAVAMSLQQR